MLGDEGTRGCDGNPARAAASRKSVRAKLPARTGFGPNTGRSRTTTPGISVACTIGESPPLELASADGGRLASDTAVGAFAYTGAFQGGRRRGRMTAAPRREAGSG